MSDDPKHKSAGEQAKADRAERAAAKKVAAEKAASTPRKPPTPKGDYVPRMQSRYKNEIKKTLREQFNYSNDMQIPAL
jgi:hypothetical protein